MNPLSRNQSRRGVVLLVLLGVALLLLGLIFSLTLKVFRSRNGSLALQKYAQAFAMAQAARVYLHAAWLDSSPTARTWRDAQAASGGYLAVPPGIPNAPVYNDATQQFVVSASTVAYPSTALASLGWFGFAPSGSQFLVLAAGGAGCAGGALNPKQAPYDTRLYLRYDPQTGRFTAGPTIDATWGALALPWARMPASP